MKGLVFMFMLSGLIGCAQQKVTTPSGITIKDIRADVPEFKREYTAKLTHGRTITLTARTWIFNDTMWSGELDQPGGRWVLFEPERVADKIIDPELVPQVQAICDEVMRIDKEYRASKPKQFTDEHGNVWVRNDR